MDLAALLSAPIILEPFSRVMIPTGIFLEIPEGYEAQIRARSGISMNHGITMVNGVGTVDSDYRGEIKIPLINLGKSPFVIRSGDRIAQMVISSYEKVHWVPEEALSATDRAAGGFGHTGKRED